MGADRIAGEADANQGGGASLGGAPDASDFPLVADAGSFVNLEPGVDRTPSGAVGGNGGSKFGPEVCPAGSMMIGVGGDFYLGADNGAGFCHFTISCSQVRVNASGALERVGDPSSVPGGSGIGFCGGPVTALPALQCAGNQVVVGMSARTSGLYGAITELQLRCATLSASAQVQLENFTESWGNLIGGNIEDISTSCPDQSVATAIVGKTGAVIDSLGFECSTVNIAP